MCACVCSVCLILTDAASWPMIIKTSNNFESSYLKPKVRYSVLLLFNFRCVLLIQALIFFKIKTNYGFS